MEIYNTKIGAGRCLARCAGGIASSRSAVVYSSARQCHDLRVDGLLAHLLLEKVRASIADRGDAIPPAHRGGAELFNCVAVGPTDSQAIPLCAFQSAIGYR
jgi:hypothetical protein